jgi:hypothetical protein
MCDRPNYKYASPTGFPKNSYAACAKPYNYILTTSREKR